MSNAAKQTIQQLIPHRDPMILVDQVLETGSDYLVASVDLARPSLFTEADGRIPSYVGLEYMAQTISAYIGVLALGKGKPIRLGFMLGSRKYETRHPYFPRGETLRVTIRVAMMDHEFGVFDCTITTVDGEEFARAQMKAIQPDDISAFLKEL